MEEAVASQQCRQAPGRCQAPQGASGHRTSLVLRPFNHVVADEARDRDKRDLVPVESSLLQEVPSLGLGLNVPLLGVVDRLLVHLVNINDHLLDSKPE